MNTVIKHIYLIDVSNIYDSVVDWSYIPVYGRIFWDVRGIVHDKVSIVKNIVEMELLIQK
jgi:hypothetical protein